MQFRKRVWLLIFALWLLAAKQVGVIATSDQPTGQPTVQPSGQPTRRPSSHPSRQPTSLPTGQPSGKPSGQPSGQPSGRPTRKPTGQPTRQPTGQPSGRPTRKPTGQPSRQPTGRPTGQPSGKPTGQPSGRPTRKPTGQPTRQPTGQPSGRPTRKPTGQPSRQPTGQPTTQPSAQPSLSPTAYPTTLHAPRKINCASGTALCEGQTQASGACSFFSPRILVLCPLSSTAACIFNGASIAFSNTYMNIAGNCEVQFLSASSITISPNSTVRGGFLSFFAQSYLLMQSPSTIDASGFSANGNNSAADSSWGGSYGGSGGRATCAKSSALINATMDTGNVYFSNVQSMVGDLNTIDDAGAMGYSGGGSNPGTGGGRVQIYTGSYLTLQTGARILANGLAPTNMKISGGSGSGGAIAINTTMLSNCSGVLSVNGGPAWQNGLVGGAGGGGGRITLLMPLSSYQNYSQVFLPAATYGGINGVKIALTGGAVSPILQAYGGTTTLPNSNNCLIGGAGTIAVLYSAPTFLSGHVLVDNNFQNSQAATILSYAAQSAGYIYRSLTLRRYAVVTTGDEIFMPSGLLMNQAQSTSSTAIYGSDVADLNCQLADAQQYGCSYLSLEDSIISLDEVVPGDARYAFAADFVDFQGNSHFVGPLAKVNVNISSLAFESDASSNLVFYFHLRLSALYQSAIAGKILQARSIYAHTQGSGLNLNALGSKAFTSTTIALSGLVEVFGGVVVFANDVVVHPTGNIRAPPGVTACRQAPVTSNLLCPNGTAYSHGQHTGTGIAYMTPYFPVPPNLASVLNYGSVYFAAVNSVEFKAQSLVEAPAILICSQSYITIGGNSSYSANLVADGRGCAGNNGSTPGQKPIYNAEPNENIPGGLIAGGAGGSNPGYFNPVYHGGNSQSPYLPDSYKYASYGGGGPDWYASQHLTPPPNLYPEPGDPPSAGSGGGSFFRFYLDLPGAPPRGNCSQPNPCSEVFYTVPNYNIIDDMYGIFNATPSYNAGGGTIVMYAQTSITHNGLISAKGALGHCQLDCAQNISSATGGGAGGSVIISTPFVGQSTGLITVIGGDAGSNAFPGMLAETQISDFIGGGGGAGGVVQMFDSTFKRQAWNFTGSVHLSGGFSSGFEGSPGQSGVVAWPPCLPGYGNSFATEGYGTSYVVKAICAPCPLGQFSPGGTTSLSFNTECSPCGALPENAVYASGVVQQTSVCACECNSDSPWILNDKDSLQSSCIVGDRCVNNFYYYFILGVGGYKGFVSINIVLFICIVVILFRKRIYKLLLGRKEKEVFARKFGTGVVYTNEKKAFDAGGGLKKEDHRKDADGNTVDRIRRMRESNHRFLREDSETFNPVSLEGSSRESAIELTPFSSEGGRSPLVQSFADNDESDRDRKQNYQAEQLTDDDMSLFSSRILQLRVRLADNDLPSHALRVYLLGTNHPYTSRGGCWKLPRSRPAALRPMLDADEYDVFVKSINRIIHWPLYGWQSFLFFVCSFIFPPFAPELLNRYRRQRADALMNFINEYDHACFKNAIQREKKDSIRIGISPCFTLAYIDYLYDIEEAGQNGPNAPLCPVGQAQLPANFRLAGLGTYFTPWYLDTNDLIVQAISQTDAPSCFIQATWIDFVFELNNRLRQLQPQGLRFGIRKILNFLDITNRSTDLGGIIVELVTFSNTLPPPNESDKQRKIRKRRKAREARRLAANASVSTFASIGSTSTGSRGLALDPKLAVITSIAEGEEYNANTRENERLRAATVAGKYREGSLANAAQTKTESGERTSLSDRVSLSGGGFDHRDSMKQQQQAETTILPAFMTNMIGGKPSDALLNSHGDATSRIAADDHDAEEEASRKAKDGCVRRFRRWLHYCKTVVTPFRDADPLGLTLDLDEMCLAVASGKLCLGIQVTHEKVRNKKYIFGDDDYMSDSEVEEIAAKEAAKETLDGSNVKVAELKPLGPSSTETDGKRDLSPRPASGGARVASDANFKARSEAVPQRLSTDGAGGMDLFPVRSNNDMLAAVSAPVAVPRSELPSNVDDGLELASESANASYGTHGNDMLKFYRIMLDAEGETEKQRQASTDGVGIAARAAFQNAANANSPTSGGAVGLSLSDTSGESSRQSSPRYLQRSPVKVPAAVLDAAEDAESGIVSFGKSKGKVENAGAKGGDDSGGSDGGSDGSDGKNKKKTSIKNIKSEDEDEDGEHAQYMSPMHDRLPQGSGSGSLQGLSALTDKASPRAAAALKLFGSHFGSSPSSTRSSFAERPSDAESITSGTDAQPRRARVYMQDEIIGTFTRRNNDQNALINEEYEEGNKNDPKKRGGVVDRTDADKALLLTRATSVAQARGVHNGFYRLVIGAHESDDDSEDERDEQGLENSTAAASSSTRSAASNTTNSLYSERASKARADAPANASSVALLSSPPSSLELRQAILTLAVKNINEARKRAVLQLDTEKLADGVQATYAAAKAYIDDDGVLYTGSVPIQEAVSLTFPNFPNYLSFQTFARHYDLATVLSEVAHLSQQPTTSQQRLRNRYEKYLLASSAYQTPVNAWRLAHLRDGDDVGQFNMGYGDNGFAASKDSSDTDSKLSMALVSKSLSAVFPIALFAGVTKRAVSDGLLAKRAFHRAYLSGRDLVRSLTKSRGKPVANTSSKASTTSKGGAKKDDSSFLASSLESTLAAVKNIFNSAALNSDGDTPALRVKKLRKKPKQALTADAFGNAVVSDENSSSSSDSDEEHGDGSNPVRQIAPKMLAASPSYRKNKRDPRASVWVPSAFDNAGDSNLHRNTLGRSSAFAFDNDGMQSNGVGKGYKGDSPSDSVANGNSSSEVIDSFTDTYGLRRRSNDTDFISSSDSSLTATDRYLSKRKPWYYIRCVARAWRQLSRNASTWHDAIMHSFTVFVVIRTILGANQRPRFLNYSTFIRKLVGFALFLFSFLDTVLYIVVYMGGKGLFCPEHSAVQLAQQLCTSEQSLPYFLVILLFWPGAIAFSVFGGFLTYLMQLKPRFTRMAVSYTRLSGISVLSIIIMFKMLVVSVNNTGADILYYAVIALLSSHCMQLVLIDQYVAHLECTRWTQGWDGLMTSLFVTQDNVKDIAESKFAAISYSSREIATEAADEFARDDVAVAKESPDAV